VWATSPGEGLGTTFYLKFPVATAPADQPPDMPHETPFLTPVDSGMVEKVENLNILIAVRPPV
jgi:hypothetical protein